MLVQESTYAKMVASKIQDAECRGREERTIELAIAFLDLADDNIISAKTRLPLNMVIRLRQQSK